MSRESEAFSRELRQIGLLKGLPPQRLDELAGHCAWRHYEAGQTLVTRESADHDLHLIVAGRVRVTSYSSAGRETSFRDLRAGECYGEVSALDGLPRSAHVVGLEPGLIASLPQPRFRELLQAEWTVNERVLLRLSALVRSLTDRVLDLSTLGVQQRICRELLRLARRQADGSWRIDPAPPHADLASAVSTYREQVTRELSALVRAGLLVKDGKGMKVVDIERLESRSMEARG
ncbi:Crp/Fnr family transcriptional regulator [Ramlibacter sp. AW1]|uniref:Crp/Fnr family transcriptional regulator n=1 Tax=Ramlibacter aurantiacus TaxID=2801330 RepID=A0A937D5U1_9BURK|nr:Crp/Fnr family transcriptional regulator [Ramlibacter aurantiacus]MBL0421657.1 Crp/Fnr family transcriptional regulator [Ramlibacter aurantiacus]